MQPNNFIQLGILIIFIGIVLIIIGSALTAKSGTTKFAFGGFIGPIPFGFGNDKTLLYATITLSIVIAAFFVTLNYLQR